MQSNRIYLCLFFMVIFISCKKNIVEPTPLSSEVVSSQTIDDLIYKSTINVGGFDWNSADEKIVWSALNHSDNIMSIGFKPAGIFFDINKIHEIDVRESAWQNAKNKLLHEILNLEMELDSTVTLKKIIPWEEIFLPVLDVVIKNPKTISWLRKSVLVRYAEPMGYEPRNIVFNGFKKENSINNATTNSSGCDENNAEIGLMASSDYFNILPIAKQSWNYQFHHIPKAWTKSTGKGVKVFFIDTGCEFDQENLGTSFNQGYSTGRTIEKIVTLPRSRFLGINTGPVETADDGCGHGTSMAGACAAPRGIDGNVVGVAYNCSLVTCRAAEDVFIEDSREAKGVADAFTNAANRTDVKIISMSLGRVTTSSQIKDAIAFAYGKGKLIFCAAGTSFSWTSGWYGVIFPATLPQVNAVTGVYENDFNTSCASCHDGVETDFTVVMEKSANAKFPLSLAMQGDIPSIVGGSSVSTATTAGIAALVWGRFPTLSRDAILNKLIQSSSNYPVRNAQLGWGNINADMSTN